MFGRVLLLSLALCGTLFSLTLEETISESLATYPRTKSIKDNYKAILDEVRISQAGYLPQLNLVAQTGSEKTKYSPNSSGIDESRYNTSSSSLVLTQNIFKGFDTMYEVRAQKARAESALFDIKDQESLHAYDTLEKYINVLKNRDLLYLDRESVINHLNIYDQIEVRTKSGFGKASDFEQVGSRLHLAKANEVIQENNLAEVMVQLENNYGKILLPNELDRPEFKYKLPNSLEEAYEISLEKHPALFRQKANIDTTKADKNRGYSGYLPSIDIEATKTLSDNPSNAKLNTDYESIFLKATLNLYGGGAYAANIETKTKRVYESLKQKDSTQRQMFQRLSLSWVAYIKFKQQLEHLEKHVQFIARTLDAYYQEFTLGKRELLDILAAENEFTQARKSYVNADYGLLLAKYRVLDGMGVLLETMGYEFLEERVGYFEEREMDETDSGKRLIENIGEYIKFDKLYTEDINLTTDINISQDISINRLQESIQKKDSQEKEVEELKQLLGE